MCLAIPGKIKKISGETALIDFDGLEKEANVSLVKVSVGDYVVVHAGFAIEKLTEEDVIETKKLLKKK